MIGNDDFPCYVDIYNHEKVDPVKSGLNLDEMKYFTSINQYMDWLVDVDSGPDYPDGPEFDGWEERSTYAEPEPLENE